MLRTCLICTLILFLFACGDDDSSSSLSASDVAGTWFNENTVITNNTCNLDDAVMKFTEKDYSKIVATDNNVDFFDCEDATCSKTESKGTYSFKSSLSLNVPDDTIDLGKESGHDCKITFKTDTSSIHFSDNSSGTYTTKGTTTKSGADCTIIKSILEKNSDAKIKEFAKLLNDSCVIEMNGDLTKQ